MPHPSLLYMLLVLLATPFARAQFGGVDVRVDSDMMDQNECAIAYNPVDPLNMIVVYNDARISLWDVGYSYTFDGGSTWVDGVIVIPGVSTLGDPVIECDLSGVFHIVYLTDSFDIAASRSLDGGLTWQPGISLAGFMAGDKPWIATDNTPGSPFAGNVYVAWNDFGAAPLRVSRSTDGGVTYSASTIYGPGGGLGLDLCVGRTGTVYSVWLDVFGSQILFDRSLDGGITWGPDIQIASITQVPMFIFPGGFRCRSFPSLGVDNSGGAFDGTLHAIWPEDNGVTAEDIVYSRSIDDGATWSPRVVINDDGGPQTQIMSWLDVGPSGFLHAIWYDMRNDPTNLNTEMVYGLSTDGGTSWIPNQVISDVSFPTTTTFMGDYIGIVASPIGVFPAWCDLRNGAEDIYIDRITAACSGICGDCDRDAAGPNILDALTAARITVLLLTPTVQQTLCCDVDGSGAIDVRDALLIAQDATGIGVTLTCP